MVGAGEVDETGLLELQELLFQGAYRVFMSVARIDWFVWPSDAIPVGKDSTGRERCVDPTKDPCSAGRGKVMDGAGGDHRVEGPLELGRPLR